MMDKLLIEAEINEASGEITDSQDLIWTQTDLAIRDKIDSYGYLFSELNAEKKKLEEIKSSGVEKVRAAIDRVDSLEKRLKLRLNSLSNGEALRGHIYSFHPFISTNSYINDVEKLSPSETYLTVEIRQDYWEQLIDAFNAIQGNLKYNEGVAYKPIDYSIKKKSGKVSELQEKHPAVMTVLTPSVRIR